MTSNERRSRLLRNGHRPIKYGIMLESHDDDHRGRDIPRGTVIELWHKDREHNNVFALNWLNVHSETWHIPDYYDIEWMEADDERLGCATCRHKCKRDKKCPMYQTM